MEASNQILLRECDFIAKELAKSGFLEDVIFELYESSVLSKDTVDTILKLDNTVTNKARYLVQQISITEECVNKFVDILLRYGIHDLAQYIHPNLSSLRDVADEASLRNPVQILPYIYPSISNPELSIGAIMPSVPPETSQSIPHCLDKTLVINVKYSQFIFGPASDIYKNLSMPRGLVFIANFDTFERDSNPPRKGSDVDVQNLTELFTRMGYLVLDPILNESKNKFLSALNKFRENKKLEEVDSCIIVIMTHGFDDQRFYTSDNQLVKVDDVLENFNNSFCPKLANKPKIFIFQFCRGTTADPGVEVPAPVLQTVANIYDDQLQTDGIAEGYTRNLALSATTSDMFLIYSTLAGYVSHRDPCTGSWLIESLCRVFMEDACEMDLDALTKKVSRKVRELCSSRGRKQTCEWRYMGFDKHYYFNPRPFIESSKDGDFNLQDLGQALPSNVSNRYSLSDFPVVTPPHSRRNFYLESGNTTPDSTYDLSPSNSTSHLRSRHYSGQSTSSGGGGRDVGPRSALGYDETGPSVRPKSRSNSFPTISFIAKTESEYRSAATPNFNNLYGNALEYENKNNLRAVPPEDTDVVDTLVTSVGGPAEDFRSWRMRNLRQMDQAMTLPDGDLSLSPSRFKRTLSVPSDSEAMKKVIDIRKYLEINELEYAELLDPITEQIQKNQNKGKRKKKNVSNSLEY